MVTVVRPTILKLKNQKTLLSIIKKLHLKFGKNFQNHIQWLNQMLIEIERANCTISEKKSQFCYVEIKIVEFICDEKKKHSDIVKIFKIVKWSSCITIKKIQKFINIFVYYWFFIENFVVISASIYILLKKNVIFVWKIFQKKVIID